MPISEVPCKREEPQLKLGVDVLYRTSQVLRYPQTRLFQPVLQAVAFVGAEFSDQDQPEHPARLEAVKPGCLQV